MIEAVASVVAVLVGVGVILAGLVRWVVMPNLREHLLEPVAENRRQLTENKHRNARPTILDRLDDIENHVDLVGLNLLALVKQLGLHVGESERDRERLWLMVESLVHDRKQKGTQDESGNQGGA